MCSSDLDGVRDASTQCELPAGRATFAAGGGGARSSELLRARASEFDLLGLGLAHQSLLCGEITHWGFGSSHFLGANRFQGTSGFLFGRGRFVLLRDVFSYLDDFVIVQTCERRPLASQSCFFTDADKLFVVDVQLFC